ncbi:MAG: nuclear transport factor 2 family protein [Proteobacteria bacterium]|nr:nuclear transport factor 2 family protein [Pseudomonadota bacterium]
MARVFLFLGLMVVALGGSAAPAPSPMTAAECAVWQRELGFAQSVANHHARAFAAYLHPGAVFIDDGGTARGAPAVVAKWAPLVRGDGVRLRWHPERVVIGGDPDTALSMGPYWFDDPQQKTTEPRFRVGRFISTWKRDRHGVWHVLFDGGGGSQPQPATTEQVLALQAKLPQTCAP